MPFDGAFSSRIAALRVDGLGADGGRWAIADRVSEDESFAGDFSIASHVEDRCTCGDSHDYSLSDALLKSALTPLTQFGAGSSTFAVSPFVYQDEIPGSTATTATIAVGASVTSIVDTIGDRDWFRIDLVAGQRYTFDLVSDGATPLTDPYLNLRSQAGALLAFDDDSGDGLNSRLTFTATSTGTYYLDAGAFTDSSTGGYRLSASVAPILPERTLDGIANFLTSEFWSPRRWTPGSNISYNIEGLSTGAQALAERALLAFASITSLSFTRTTGTAQITFQNTASGAYAQTFTSGSSGGFLNITAATINVSSTWSSGNLDLDSYTYQTYLHEVGHAIGLGHGGPYNGSATYGTDNVYANDTWNYTVMSYFSQQQSGYGTNRFVLAPQIADIIAVHNLYGADAAGTRTGNTVYGFNSTETDINNWAQFTVTFPEGVYRQPPAYAIYDTGGTDTIDLSGYSTAQTLNLNPETFSTLGTRPTVLEPHFVNVISIARGTIIENAIGGSGDDMITGNSANNRITLGAGSDIYVMRANGGSDTITDFSVTQDRIDLRTLSAPQQQAAVSSVRNSGGNTVIDIAGGTLTLTGINYTLVTAARFLLGSLGDIIGTDDADTVLGTSGNDIMSGLAGDDTLSGFGGNDTLNGDDGNDILWGGAGTNQLNGGNGNDVLVSESTGDSLNGGEGADTYILNFGGTFITDAGTSAGDLIYSYGSLALANGIEAGVMFAGGSTLTGNSLNNLLIGNSGNTTISGGEGDDTIYGVGGTNQLNGNDGNDIMVSGTGFDTMTGGLGDDVYIISAPDTVVELSGQGTDTVYVVGGNYTLTSAVEIGVAFGAITVNGNSINNTLIGDGGGNILSGFGGSDFIVGGAGNDYIYGGAGLDTLQGNTGFDLFHYAAFGDLGDVIQDYVEADDYFTFNAAAFGFSAGQSLVAGVNFFSSTAPVAGGFGPCFLWDSDDTVLYYDPDGAGATGVVLVADLQAFTNLTVLDFVFVTSAEEPDDGAALAEEASPNLDTGGDPIISDPDFVSKMTGFDLDLLQGLPGSEEGLEAALPPDGLAGESILNPALYAVQDWMFV